MNWLAKVTLLMILGTLFYRDPWFGILIAASVGLWIRALESRQRLWRPRTLNRLRRRLNLPEGAVAPREGPLREHAVLCSPECIEIRFNRPLSHPFHLSCRDQGSSDWDAEPLGDTTFDRRFSLTTTDPAALVYFPRSLRRRLYDLGSFAMDEKGFYLYADNPLLAEITDFKTHGYVHRLAARARFMFTNVPAYRLAILTPLMEALSRDLPADQRLAEALFEETEADCGARMATLFICLYRDRVTHWFTAVADAETRFHLLFLRALAGPRARCAERLQQCLPACPLGAAPIAFEEIRNLAEPEIIALSALGLAYPVLAPHALESLVALRTREARETLLDFISMKPKHEHTLAVIEALEIFDEDPRVCSFLLETVPKAGANQAPILKVLGEIGTRETLTALVELSKTRTVLREEVEAARFVLRAKHGLLNDHGGMLSLSSVEENKGALSRAQQQNGDLCLSEPTD